MSRRPGGSRRKATGKSAGSGAGKSKKSRASGRGSAVGQRLRVAITFGVVLAAGVLLGSGITQWLTYAPERLPEMPVLHVGERLRVEVLNASGEQGMASLATDELRDLGFDVVYFGNAETFDLESSVVLDRVGRLDAARSVADALGIRTIRSEPDSNLYLDTTVRLGRDWVPASERTDQEEPEERPWWDLRRFRR